MKRALTALLLSTAFVASAAAQDLPETTLTVIGGNSSQPSWQDVEVGFWSRELPEAAGGRVTVSITAWNEMGLKGSEMFHLLRQGVAPISHLNLSYNTGDVKIISGLDLALLSPSLEDANRVIEAFRPEFQRVFEESYGIKVLALYPLPPQILYCRDKLQSLSDIKGRKVRVSTTSQADFVQHYGGSDASIAFGEVQTALQTGVIDCGITSSTAGYKTAWYEAANYLYPIPINWNIVGYFANVQEWENFPPELQAFVEEQMRVLEGKLALAHSEEGELGIRCLTGEGECSLGQPGKMQLVAVTAEDEASRREALEQTILPRWATACGQECVDGWNATVGQVMGLTARAP